MKTLMYGQQVTSLLTGLLLVTSFASGQKPTETAAWERFKYFEGSWKGTGAGEPGNSTVERRYEFVLGGKYLSVKNRSTYPPQEKNPKGEIHDDWGFISRDKSRRLFIYRQFNVEGFVNHYALDTLATDSMTTVFVTESIENIPPGWRGRETYKRVGPDEFIETFELAGPGKEFELYSRAQLKRLKE